MELTIKIKEQSIELDPKESKLYRRILDSLGVAYEVKEAKQDQVDVPIYVLFEELDVRANNAIRSVVNGDVTITLSTFVSLYSKRDILKFRNVGKHTLNLVVEAFEKFGYELK